MFRKFMKLMEYRSYCMSIKQLRDMGMYDKAQEISEFKRQVYETE